MISHRSSVWYHFEKKGSNIDRRIELNGIKLYTTNNINLQNRSNESIIKSSMFMFMRFVWVDQQKSVKCEFNASYIRYFLKNSSLIAQPRHRCISIVLQCDDNMRDITWRLWYLIIFQNTRSENQLLIFQVEISIPTNEDMYLWKPLYNFSYFMVNKYVF